MNDLRARIVLTLMVSALGSGAGFETPTARAAYIAKKRDGSEVRAEQIDRWGEEKSPGYFRGEALDHDHPFRWIVSTDAPAVSLPESYIEFVGGDRLPGRVIGFSPARSFQHRTEPAHLIVTPSVPLHHPHVSGDRTLRIRLDWVTRVVWRHRPGFGFDSRFQQPTVLLTDGAELSYRSLRWGADRVTLLLPDGIRVVPFDDIAAILFETIDPVEAHLEQLAMLIPDGTGQLRQSIGSDGLIATTSRQRFRPTYHGSKSKPNDWLHMMQPAWSLDPMWLRFPRLIAFRFYDAAELPLSRLAPNSIERTPVFAHGWRTGRDRNAEGGTLGIHDRRFGWGFGVHGSSSLAFDLPAFTTGFETEYGLDRSVGDGGYLSITITIDDQTVHTSEPLRGSNAIQKTGFLSLDANDREKPFRMVLRTNGLEREAPSEADPFDIRDLFNWADPVVSFDPDRLSRAVRQRIGRVVPSLAKWNAPEPGPERWSAAHQWSKGVYYREHFLMPLTMHGPHVTFHRTARIPQTATFLAVETMRLDRKSPEGTVRISAGDGKLGNTRAIEYKLPDWNGSDGWRPRPLLLDVSDLRGERVPLRITFIPRDKPLTVIFQDASFVEETPTHRRLFEDEAEFAATLNALGGDTELVQEERFAGTSALSISGNSAGGAVLPGWSFDIRERPGPGEFRYLRFAWKTEDASLIGLELGHDGQLGSARDAEPYLARRATGDAKGEERGFRYVAGRANMPFGKHSVQIGTQPPEGWTVVTRDLHYDFGEFTLTGLNIIHPDGKRVLIDHVSLAREIWELDRIPKRYHPENRDRPEQWSPFTASGYLEREDDQTAVLAKIAPGWTHFDREGYMEYRGDDYDRTEVLKLHNWKSDQTPSVFRTVIDTGKEPETTANISFEAQPSSNGSFEVRVIVEGREQHRRRIEWDQEQLWGTQTFAVTLPPGSQSLIEVEFWRGPKGDANLLLRDLKLQRGGDSSRTP